MVQGSGHQDESTIGPDCAAFGLISDRGSVT